MKQRVFKKSMLEYCKIILKKMRFNKKLFIKEYRKTFQYLDAREHKELKKILRQAEAKDRLLIIEQNRLRKQSNYNQYEH